VVLARTAVEGAAVIDRALDDLGRDASLLDRAGALIPINARREANALRPVLVAALPHPHFAGGVRNDVREHRVLANRA
jgi:hypothetical protein